MPNDVPFRNSMTCDVEDYFHVSAFENRIHREDWEKVECRLPRNIDRILQIFLDSGVKGTFFTLGWVAARYPEVIRRIAEEGHEIASHGMQHTRVWRQTPESFLQDISDTKKRLEDTCGIAVRGYRAASWSIDERVPWAHDVIAEAGYEYSSSIYPISHDHFGMHDAPSFPFYAKRSGILEIPASTVSIAGRKIPAAGGGFFRLFPLSFSMWMIRHNHAVTGLPAVFYFHPWELDPGQPRISEISWRTRFRHYLNLEKVTGRLVKLCRRFRWDRMDRIYLDVR
jgi:polysaccharide deacetylase family protein (PEP-CTERM system associated)